MPEPCIPGQRVRVAGKREDCPWCGGRQGRTGTVVAPTLEGFCFVMLDNLGEAPATALAVIEAECLRVIAG